jgi:hypothetical protein
MTLALLAAQPVPPLEPVPFRTVATDDGAASRLTERITTGVETAPYHVVRVRRSRDRVSFQRHPVERDC